MSAVVLDDKSVEALRRHHAGGDKAEAVRALTEQGIPATQIADIVDLSKRQVYRLRQESDGSHSVEVDVPHQGAMRELTADEKELIYSHTPEGFELFFSIFSHLIPGSVEGPLPPHALPWVRSYFEHPLLMINVPPRHWKSVVFSVAMPTYEIVCNRQVRILLLSRSADLATQWTRNIGSLLKEDKFVRAFGRFAPDWKGQSQWSEAVGTLRVQGGADYTIRSRGSGTQVLGFGADIVIADDPSNTEIAQSQLESEREFERFQKEALTRLDEHEDQGGTASKVMVIGQRLGPKDFFHRVAELTDETGARLFRVERSPAVKVWPDRDPETGKWLNVEKAEVLDPVHWPWPKLVKKLNLLGPAKFATMFQQEPRASGGGLMSQETFQKARDSRTAWTGMRERAARAIKNEGQGRLNPFARVLSVDPSPTMYHGLVVADVAVNGVGETDIWVLGCTRMKARQEGGLEAFLTAVNEYAVRFKVDIITIEESTFSKWMRESPWWSKIFDRSNAPRYLKQLTTSTNKNSMEFGLSSLEADFDLGRVHLPYGDEEAVLMTDLLEEEAYSYEPGSGKGGLDDILMALWFIKSQAKKLRVREPKPDHFTGRDGREVRSDPLTSFSGAPFNPPTARTPAEWRAIQRGEQQAAEKWEDWVEPDDEETKVFPIEEAFSYET